MNEMRDGDYEMTTGDNGLGYATACGCGLTSGCPRGMGGLCVCSCHLDNPSIDLSTFSFKVPSDTDLLITVLERIVEKLDGIERQLKTRR